MPAVPVLTETRTVTVKIIVNRRNELLSRNQLHCLVNILYFLGIYRLFTFEGFTCRKSSPEQTRILPVNYNLYIYIYILLTTNDIGRVLMLLSIFVEVDLSEERAEDVTITTSQLRHSGRGGFTLRCIMMCLHDYD